MSFLPLISVIMPVYNHESYVSTALQSILAQTYSRLEMIVLNDGSTDMSAEKINKLINECQTRFERFEFVDKVNEGLSKTLNRGIEWARGEYVFLIASDDFVEANAILDLYGLIHADSSAGLACSDADFIDANGYKKVIEGEHAIFHTFFSLYTFSRPDFDFSSEFGTYRSLLPGNYISIGLLLRRSAILDVGSFDTTFALEDWEMWLRLSKKYKLVHTPKILAHYRVHSHNSHVVMSDRLTVDGVRLFLREYSYCKREGLLKDWSQGFYKTLELLKGNFAPIEGVDYKSALEMVVPELASKNLENIKLRNELNRKSEELTRLYLSRSWKITKPLRRLNSFLKLSTRRENNSED